jgi:hypothetical protein
LEIVTDRVELDEGRRVECGVWSEVVLLSS